MTDNLLPFSRVIDLASGKIDGTREVLSRRLSDMRGWYADSAAEASLLGRNPLIYTVYFGYSAPDDVEGQLGFCTTIMQPGKIGDEYHMTKGHYHAKSDRAEIYYTLQGAGKLVLQTREGVTSVQNMLPGVIAYIPAYYAHRTVNVGADNFVFLSVYPSDSGYDYASIAEKGFASLVVERDGKPTVIPNPRYR